MMDLGGSLGGTYSATTYWSADIKCVSKITDGCKDVTAMCMVLFHYNGDVWGGVTDGECSALDGKLPGTLARPNVDGDADYMNKTPTFSGAGAATAVASVLATAAAAVTAAFSTRE